jgi:catechol 2,3-dioxygenase-like lactoylglutathione lyase family enzyme
MKSYSITHRIMVALFAMISLSFYIIGCGVDEEEENMLPTSADQPDVELVDQTNGEPADQADSEQPDRQPPEEEEVPPPPADQPDNEPPDPQPPEPAPVFTPNKVNHVGFGVRDIERSEEFYTDVLGLEVGYRGGSMIFVRLGESSLELFKTQGRDELAVDKTIGIRHFLICVGDLQEAYDALRAKGVEFYIAPGVDRPIVELPDQQPPDENAVFEPIKLHHVALGVRDFEKSIAFYTETLELELIYRDASMAHVRLGESALELLRTEGHDEMAIEQIIGFRHFSIGVNNLRESYEALKAKGVRFHIPLTNGMYAFFKDPDNISVEINDFNL